jgi:tetratricopeptide (TPR) repeat protein
MKRVAWALPLLSAGVLLGGACTSQPNRTGSDVTATEAVELPPVALPDLSPMEAPVRKQMAERHQALVAKVAAPATPVADLARAYGEVGALLMAAEYFEAAEPYLLHAQSLAPNETRWPYYLGHAYMARSASAKAVASFQQVLHLQPTDLATLVWLGNLHLDQGEPQLAEPLFSRALAMQPRMVAALFGLGRAALARREFARAADQLEQVLAADPRASIAHYPLALAYRALGDTARAEAHLRQRGGVEVGPPDPLMMELRGLLQGSVAEEARGVRALDSRDFNAAVQSFRKAVDLAPDNPSLHHKLGTALSLAGNTTGAVEQFQEAVRLSPNFAQAHYSLGVLLAASGRPQEAVVRLSAAVRYQPDYIEARLQLAEALRQVGQLEQSLGQYRDVLAIDPRVADARFGHAMTLVALKRYPEALGSFRESARLYPDQPRFAAAVTRLEGALKGGR